ncbi:MAG TPA: Gfo/Idh/MocA family oxidoreductase [Myxococcota bacterium]|nr:Gfo/Idh/MocA family oxidoreductase [Myxococcota bacterium]
MRPVVRFALIGCGGIGQIRARALRATPELRLVAAADAEASRAAQAATPHGAAVLRDWRACLGRDDVDAVIVSTPPALHAEMCVEALRAGKHVLVEKPLARNPEECGAILEAERASGRFLATGFNYRFYPSVRAAREALDAGAVGALDHVRSYSGYTAADHSHAWLHELDAMGGGALRDNGIHLIDLTRWFLGEVDEVKGFRTNAVWRFPGCEDNGYALLRSEAGRVATLHASWTEWAGYQFRIELYGDRGRIRLSCFPMTVDVLSAAERGGPLRRRRHVYPLLHLMEKWKSYRWVVERSFVEEHRAFAAATRGERSAVATGLDGARAVEIAAAVDGGEEARP